MSAYNFKSQFADAVESGRKHHTIRAPRKDGRLPKLGEVLYLYTGMRTKKCRLLRTALCESVTPIRITKRGLFLKGVRADNLSAVCIALNDGFESLPAMISWFQKTHGLPFRGFLIKWEV